MSVIYRRSGLPEDAVLPGVGSDSVEGGLQSGDGLFEALKFLEEGDRLDLVDGPFRLLIQFGHQIIDFDELEADQILEQLRFLSGRLGDALDRLGIHSAHHSSPSVGDVTCTSDPTEGEPPSPRPWSILGSLAKGEVAR